MSMTLFERVTYRGEEDNVKISIHMIRSLMSELGAERLSIPQVVQILNLDQDQTTQFTNVLSSALSSSSPSIFSSRIFAYLILAENSHRDSTSVLDYYRDENNFWSMINQEALK